MSEQEGGAEKRKLEQPSGAGLGWGWSEWNAEGMERGMGAERGVSAGGRQMVACGER